MKAIPLSCSTTMCRVLGPPQGVFKRKNKSWWSLCSYSDWSQTAKNRRITKWHRGDTEGNRDGWVLKFVEHEKPMCTATCRTGWLDNNNCSWPLKNKETFLCMCIGRYMSRDVWRSEDNLRIWFSSPTWVLGFKFRLSSSFPGWATLPTCIQTFKSVSSARNPMVMHHLTYF